MHRTRGERLWCSKLAVSHWKATACDGRLHCKWPPDHWLCITHFRVYVLDLGIFFGILQSPSKTSQICTAWLFHNFQTPGSHCCRVHLFGFFSIWELLPLRGVLLHHFHFIIYGKHMLHRIFKRFEFPILEWNNNELQMLKMFILKNLLYFFLLFYLVKMMMYLLKDTNA